MSVPNVYNVALKILGAPATSAACERSFSLLGNIQNVKKNKLTNEKAAKLLFDSDNLKLLNCNCKAIQMQLLPSLLVSSANNTSNKNTKAEAPHEKPKAKDKQGSDNENDLKLMEISSQHTSDSDTDNDLSEEDIPYQDSSGSDNKNEDDNTDSDREGEVDKEKNNDEHEEEAGTTGILPLRLCTEEDRMSAYFLVLSSFPISYVECRNVN